MIMTDSEETALENSLIRGRVVILLVIVVSAAAGGRLVRGGVGERRIVSSDLRRGKGA